MVPTLDAVLLGDWADAAAAALERHRAEIDRINVFPVADRDTGTNLLLTMRAAVAAVGSGAPSGAAAGATAQALAAGALRGARGNSGVILSQVLRGVAEAVVAAAGPGGGAVLADALDRAARLAAEAMTRPREGTVLTVLAAAAAAAREAVAREAVAREAVARGAGEGGTGAGDRLDEVVLAAADAAAGALRDTTGQLPELARAGVVDAGGLGLCVVLDALATRVTGRVPATYPTAGVATEAPGAAVPDAGADGRHEVMFLLDGSDDARAATLRTALDGLGDAVTLVGDGAVGGTGTWTVHLHCADIGAALEAGVRAGRPYGVRIVPLVELGGVGTAVFTRDRAVLAVTSGATVTALARDAGADVLDRGRDATVPDETALAAALSGTGARHVALLPGDAGLGEVAERAAGLARGAGQEVVVVPAFSPVAGLAALAVHDPTRHAADDVVAMTEAAAGTRTGALLIAESEALTWAGRCRRGDVLGLVDGEVVLIAPDLSVGALWLASRMVAAGGELVTVLLGAEVADAFGEQLVAALRRRHPEVDVVVHRGARPGRPVELGVE